jgi:hypothetical protein
MDDRIGSMSPGSLTMPLLFSYGTLQQEQVQGESPQRSRQGKRHGCTCHADTKKWNGSPSRQMKERPTGG